MAANLQLIELNQFNGGLNLRDDENSLRLTETANMQNIEIEALGLKKSPGWLKILASLPSHIFLEGLWPYRLTDGTKVFISVSYPYILILDPTRGDFQYVMDGATSTVFKGLRDDGKPYGKQVGDFFVLVDGANDPVAIDQNKSYGFDWKPSYTVNNSDQIPNSYLTSSGNPASTEIGYPSTFSYHKNRLIFNDTFNRRRLYFGKLNAFSSGETSGFATMFGDNSSTTDVNIAFFLGVPCDNDIVAMEIISERNLLIYCESQMILMTGNDPPIRGFTGQPIDFNTLNNEIGCLDQRLLVKKGDNDHYFVTNKKTVYQATLTDKLTEIKPKGLSDRIYPVLDGLSIETLKRGFLANHRIKGELYFFFPSANNLRYSDVGYVLNYEDSENTELPGWSRMKDFTTLNNPIKFRGISEIDIENKLYMISENALHEMNSGVAFGDNANVSVYQFPTIDFGSPKNKHRIADITFYATSETGANINYYHLWESGASGATRVYIPQNTNSKYGTATYGNSKYTSKAGNSFQEIKFKIPNRVGKLFKAKIEHSSTTEKFTIHKIEIRYETFGQKN